MANETTKTAWHRQAEAEGKSVWEILARANGWTVTLNHRDEYVAHDNHPDSRDTEPAYILDAEDEDEAWEELCREEGIDPETAGAAEEQQPDGTWKEV